MDDDDDILRPKINLIGEKNESHESRKFLEHYKTGVHRFNGVVSWKKPRYISITVNQGNRDLQFTWEHTRLEKELRLKLVKIGKEQQASERENIKRDFLGQEPLISQPILSSTAFNKDNFDKLLRAKTAAFVLSEGSLVHISATNSLTTSLLQKYSPQFSTPNLQSKMKSPLPDEHQNRFAPLAGIGSSEEFNYTLARPNGPADLRRIR